MTPVCVVTTLTAPYCWQFVTEEKRQKIKGDVRKFMSEDYEQRQLIQWCRTDPRLQFLFHIPNESASGAKWGIRNRQLGVKSGVPDLMLPIPSGGYHGLFVEMKAKNGKVSENQEKWLSALNTFGYRAVVCYGWEAARDEIKAYLAADQ